MMKTMIIAGAILSFVGVALGAFAAHMLKTRLSPDLYTIFEVGVRYHMYHALALLAVAWCMVQFPQLNLHVTGYCFIAGIIIFSGSLYALSFTGLRWIGGVTPVGGICFLFGWFWLAWSVARSI